MLSSLNITFIVIQVTKLLLISEKAPR